MLDFLSNPEARKDYVRRLVDTYVGNIRENKAVDPTQLIVELSKMKTTDEEYERLIPEVEKDSLQLIQLLRDYQIGLRGDSVEREVQPWFLKSGECLSMVRNEFHPLTTSQNQMDMLGEVLVKLEDARRSARRHEYYQFQDSKQARPMIVYGFHKFNVEEKVQPQEDVYQTFRGGTDDIGLSFKDLRIVDLPPASAFGSDKTTPEDVELFPVFDQEGPRDLANARVDRFTQGLIDANYLVFMRNPKTYFNYSAITHKILHDLKRFADKK